MKEIVTYVLEVCWKIHLKNNYKVLKLLTLHIWHCKRLLSGIDIWELLQIDSCNNWCNQGMNKVLGHYQRDRPKLHFLYLRKINFYPSLKFETKYQFASLTQMLKLSNWCCNIIASGTLRNHGCTEVMLLLKLVALL